MDVCSAIWILLMIICFIQGTAVAIATQGMHSIQYACFAHSLQIQNKVCMPWMYLLCIITATTPRFFFQSYLMVKQESLQLLQFLGALHLGHSLSFDSSLKTLDCLHLYFNKQCVTSNFQNSFNCCTFLLCHKLQSDGCVQMEGGEGEGMWEQIRRYNQHLVVVLPLRWQHCESLTKHHLSIPSSNVLHGSVTYMYKLLACIMSFNVFQTVDLTV